ncbi:MAG: hypothetical protein K9K38_13535 [Rhodoferax sp.]|nr:hypothetical protein [Rhodoferax sp.]
MQFSLIFAAMVALALAFVVVPALRHRQSLASASAVEMHGNYHKRIAGALLLLMPLVSYGLYQHLGAPQILGAHDMLQARGQHDVDSMMAALEARLKANPNDVEALYVMGRSYLALQRGTDAEAALAKASQLAPKEARMLSHYAEAMAMNRNGDLQGAVLALIEQALELDYEDEKALELAGLAAYQRQDWAQAVHFWRRLLKRLPADTEFHQDMSRAIADAEQKSAAASGLGERAKLQPPAKKAMPH